MQLGDSNANHSAGDRGLEELCRIRHSHLFHHVCPVGLDRFDADIQTLADFLIFETVPNEFENFLLPLRE